MMDAVLASTSIGIAAAGLVTLGLATTYGAGWRRAIPVTMELWTAAGLLRLVGEPSWIRIATAATIIAVRRLIVLRGTLG